MHGQKKRRKRTIEGTITLEGVVLVWELLSQPQWTNSGDGYIGMRIGGPRRCCGGNSSSNIPIQGTSAGCLNLFRNVQKFHSQLLSGRSNTPWRQARTRSQVGRLSSSKRPNPIDGLMSAMGRKRSLVRCHVSRH